MAPAHSPDELSADRPHASARLALVEADGEARRRLLRALRLKGLEVAVETGEPERATQLSIQHAVGIVILGLPLGSWSAADVVHALWEAAPAALIVLHGRDTDAAAGRLVEAFVDKAKGSSALAEAVARLQATERHADTFHLDGSLQDVRQCRETLRSLFEHWQLPRASGEVQVVLSELVTNAIRHGLPPIGVRVAQSGPTLRLVVSDSGRGVPSIVSPSRCADHGRGLVLISGLSRAWGVVPRAVGKDVWAELDDVKARRGGRPCGTT